MGEEVISSSLSLSLSPKSSSNRNQPWLEDGFGRAWNSPFYFSEGDFFSQALAIDGTRGELGERLTACGFVRRAEVIGDVLPLHFGSGARG